MDAFSKSTGINKMNMIFGLFVTIIALGINGLFYYATYSCFKTVIDRKQEMSWRAFNFCYCLMAFGAAGAISVGIIVLVFI